MTIIQNSKFKIQNYTKGFTIMELIILLAIISIMMSGILTLFFNVITVNKSSAYYSAAYKTMDSKVEELRGLSFDQIVNSEQTDITNLPPGSKINVNVTNEIDGAPQEDIKEVRVKVSWTFRKYTEINEVTYIAKGGIKK